MKIKVDDEIVFELTEGQKKVICNEILTELIDSDIKRRVRWVIEHKYERCFEALKKEWETKLVGRVKALPLDKDELAELIFSQPDYKNRSQRSVEE